MADNLGFGLALDLGTNDLIKAGETIKKTLGNIFDSSVVTKKGIKNLSGSLMENTDVSLNQHKKLSSSFKKTSERIKGLGSTYTKNIKDKFGKFSNDVLNPLKENFQKFTDNFKEGFSEIGDEIGKAKIRLAAFVAAAADIAILETKFAQLNKTANFGVKSYRELFEVSVEVSNSLGLVTNAGLEATEALSQYGKTILRDQGITSEFTKETLKTALMMETAWNIALSDSIELLDDLYRFLGLNVRQGRKFIEGMKSISDTTGVAIKELMDLNKRLIATSRAMRGFVDQGFLQDSQEFAGLLQQLGGDFTEVFTIWQDLQAPQTLGNWAEMLGVLGIDPMTAAAGSIKDLGLEIGRTLAIMDSPVLKAQLNQLGLNFLQQEALIEAYRRGGEITKNNSDITKDFNEIMATNSKAFKRIFVAARKFYMLALIPIMRVINPIIRGIANFSESLITLFDNTGDTTKSLIGLGAAFLFIGGPLIRIFGILTKMTGVWGLISKSAIGAFKLIMPGIGALKLAVTGVGKGFMFLGGAAMKAGIAIATALAPALPIILTVGAAIGALVATFIFVRRHWESFSTAFAEGFTKIWEGIRSIGGGLKDFVLHPFKEVTRIMKSIASAFSLVIKGDFKGAVTELGGILKGGAIGQVTVGVKNVAEGVAKDIAVPIVQAAGKDAKLLAGKALEGISDLTKGAKDLVGAGLAKTGEIYGDIRNLFRKQDKKERDEEVKSLQALNRVNLAGLYSGISRFFVDTTKNSDDLQEKSIAVQEEIVKSIDNLTTVTKEKDTAAKVTVAGPRTKSETQSSQTLLTGVAR